MMNWIVLWSLVALISLVVELATTALVSIWFTGGALAALVLAILNVSPGFQILAFIAVSLLLIFACRNWISSNFFPDRLPSNMDRLIGSVATVTSSIGSNQNGRVLAGGQDWMAISADDSFIPKGCLVRIMKISGAKLIVLPVSADEKGK